MNAHLLLLRVTRESHNVSVAEYKARVYSSWLGQCIGNIYSLPRENRHIDQPGPDNFSNRSTASVDRLKATNGVFSDDDNGHRIHVREIDGEVHGIAVSLSEMAPGVSVGINGKSSRARCRQPV